MTKIDGRDAETAGPRSKNRCGDYDRITSICSSSTR